MNSREQIFKRVSDALAPLPKRAALPDVPTTLFAPIGATSVDTDQRPRGPSQTELWSEFASALRAAHGTSFTTPGEMFAFLLQGGYTVGYCDPQLWPALQPHVPAGVTVQTTFERAQVDDYTFGITAAAGAIAATGTLILTDRGTSSRLGALAPWVHIAIVRDDQIHPDLASAVAALPKDPNVIWVTGPSKTADVEGILIEGVHGPGVQAALRL